MKRIKILILALITLAYVAEDANAQRFNKKRYWSVGGSLNAMNFVGDVTGSKSPMSIDFTMTKPNVSVTILRRLSPRVSVRGNFFWGRLKGNDRKSSDPNGNDWGRYHRGANFKNDIQEFSTTVVVDFFENRGTYAKRPDYTPYGFLGLAVLYHNPVTSNKTSKNVGAGDWNIPVKSISGQNVNSLTGAFLYGLGFRYKLATSWDLAFEIGWRKTFTDWIDGVSGDRLDKQDVTLNATYDKTFVYDNAADHALIDVYAAPVGSSASPVKIVENGVRLVDDAVDPSLLATSTVTTAELANYATRTDANYYTQFSVPGEMYGDSKQRTRNDGYIVTGLHLTYIIHNGVKCPKFR